MKTTTIYSDSSVQEGKNRKTKKLTEYKKGEEKIVI